MQSANQELTDLLKSIFANYKVHFQKLLKFRWHLQNENNKKLTQLLERYGRQTEMSIDRIVGALDRFSELPLVDMSSCMRWAEIKTIDHPVSSDHLLNEVVSDCMTIKDQLILLKDKAVSTNRFELFKTSEQLQRNIEARISKMQLMFAETVE